jgi:chorismate-pyruvate lyase
VKIRDPKPRVHARTEMPPEKLAEVAAKLGDSPLKKTLERMSREHTARRKPTSE